MNNIGNPQTSSRPVNISTGPYNNQYNPIPGIINYPIFSKDEVKRKIKEKLIEIERLLEKL